METMYIKPVNGDWTRECRNLGNVIALYKDTVVNVGNPSLAPYYPQLSNMFGYNKASEKGIFEKVTFARAEKNDAPVYVIGVNWDNCVMLFIKPANEAAELNPVFDSDLSEYEMAEDNSEVRKLKRVQ